MSARIRESVRGRRRQAIAAATVVALVCAGLIGLHLTGLPGQGGATDGKPASARQVDDSMSHQAEADGKAVNLTLDDGPDPTWTPKALELLKRYDAKAVFCMIGPNAAAHPDLVKQVVAAGHRLCDHSVHHDVTMDDKPVSYQRAEIEQAEQSIEAASGGVRPRYYRAPGGAFTPESRKFAASLGMRPLGWRIDPGDFERPGVDKIVQNVEAGVRAGHQTILMHDGGGDRSQTLAALERLLPWLKEQGYTFSFPKA